MKVLFAASEVAPIVKLGGLGDVIGSLPKALTKLGVNVDVIVPLYPSVNLSKQKFYRSMELHVAYDLQDNLVDVYKTKLPDSNVDVFLLKNDKYFFSGGSKAFANNISETEMFAFFNKAVVEFIKTAFNIYDLIHCHDWHTGLITHLLEDEMGLERPKTLFTIHNLLYQGVGNDEVLKDIGVVPGSHRTIDWDIADDNLNMLLQGIVSSDYVSAVSPTYANEILTSEYGGKLNDVLKSREGCLTGILNGIDYSFFPRSFSDTDFRKAKHEYKTYLKNKTGLSKNLQNKKDDAKPIFSFIGRLDAKQKGLDILFKAIPFLVKHGGQFVLLGTGDVAWENKLRSTFSSDEYKSNVSINIQFDTEFANLIYNASDFILVPSKYEPCGLIQMIAMHYGALPIVRNTGGLKDSVIDGVDGFKFDEYSADALNSVIDKALRIYNSPKYDSMVLNAIHKDFSWKESAIEYKNLYAKIIGDIV